jgi:hypothetical protein
MFNFSKYKTNAPYFNKTESNDNNFYILEDSNEINHKKYQSNNTDIIIDIPMLEEVDNLELSTYKNNSNNSLRYEISENKKTLFNMLKESNYKSKSIYRFIKPRRLYKKYNYIDYPFYKSNNV